MEKPYDEDGIVTAFTGEEGRATAAKPKVNQGCYPQYSPNPGKSFIIKGLYIGTNDGCLADQGLNYDNHPAYDYVAEIGTPVYAAASGRVVKIVNKATGLPGRCVPKGIETGGCGIWGYVGIDHGNGYVTQYGHLSRIDVQSGDEIKAGALIGLSGQSSPPKKDKDGNVTKLYSVPPHFHFEVLKENAASPYGYAFVDPYGWEGDPRNDPLEKAIGIPNVRLWKAGAQASPAEPKGSVAPSSTTVPQNNNYGNLIDETRSRKTRIALSPYYYTYNGRDMREWRPLFAMARSQNVELIENNMKNPLANFDIIIWDTCSYENSLLFAEIDDLIAKGKMVVLTGTNSCVTNDKKSKDHANVVLRKYGMILTDDDPDYSFEVSVVRGHPITDGISNFLGFRNPYIKIIDSTNVIPLAKAGENIVMAIYEDKKSGGAIIAHGYGPNFLFGAFNYGTKTTDYRLLQVFKNIVNYQKVKTPHRSVLRRGFGVEGTAAKSNLGLTANSTETDAILRAVANSLPSCRGDYREPLIKKIIGKYATVDCVCKKNPACYNLTAYLKNVANEWGVVELANGIDAELLIDYGFPKDIANALTKP